jgi:precorrin-8X/cobalt-precorrin-8 methylmutase
MYVHVPPGEIEPRSLAIIDAEVPEPRPFAGDEWAVARRMVHTTADFDLLNHIRFHPGAVRAGREALLAGADIVTDTRMALAGIPSRRLTPLGCSARCLMDEARVAARARAEGVTRAWAAVDEVMDGGGADIFVIGNAPTALYRLLERVASGARPPRLVVGMPVGFVNAAESKDLLLAQDAVPYIAVAGRKGGSALAASVVNALLILAGA